MVFNPDKPKVSTRRLRKQHGRFSIEGHSAKEEEGDPANWPIKRSGVVSD